MILNIEKPLLEELMQTAEKTLVVLALPLILEVNEIGGTKPQSMFEKTKEKVFQQLPGCQAVYQELAAKHKSVSDVRLMNLAIAKTVVDNHKPNGDDKHFLFLEGINDAFDAKLQGDSEKAKTILEAVNEKLRLNVTDNEVAFVKDKSPRNPKNFKHQSPYCESKTKLMAQRLQVATETFSSVS